MRAYASGKIRDATIRGLVSGMTSLLGEIGGYVVMIFYALFDLLEPFLRCMTGVAIV